MSEGSNVRPPWKPKSFQVLRDAVAHPDESIVEFGARPPEGKRSQIMMNKVNI